MSFREDLNSRLDDLLGPVVLGILLGKMVGDYAAYKLTTAYGTELGLLIGIVLAVIPFLLWPPVEKWLQGEYED